MARSKPFTLLLGRQTTSASRLSSAPRERNSGAGSGVPKSGVGAGWFIEGPDGIPDPSKHARR
jgi:hypothetical protein